MVRIISRSGILCWLDALAGLQVTKSAVEYNKRAKTALREALIKFISVIPSEAELPLF